MYVNLSPFPQVVCPLMYLFSLRERGWWGGGGEALVFCDTFDIIISHILPENFIEISQVVQKI